jgi:hypothetical protein
MRLLLILIGVFLIGCRHNMAQTESSEPKRDINAVLRDHDKELMAIPNVVGVYVGVLRDGKTLCLKVMIARKSAATEQAIPRSIEGFRVITEVTGEIRPLDAH